MSGRRALITGITGQDGQLLARFLLQRGYRVVGFGRKASIVACAGLREMPGLMKFHFGDLADPISLLSAMQEHQPDEVYSLAAQSSPGLSWSTAVQTGLVTGLGAVRVFDAVRHGAPLARVYHASSSEMFGDAEHAPQDERTPFSPRNPYAAAKAYAHQMAHIYRNSYGLHISCGILFNHESPLRGMEFLTQKVSYGAACAGAGIAESPLLNEEGEPIVHRGQLALGNLDAARDWGAAEDYVEAMWRMLQHERAEDFVIGTGVLRTVRELCEVAYRHVGLDWRDHVVSDPRFFRPIETGATVADPGKALRLLDWAPRVTFEAMIARMVDQHRARLAASGAAGAMP